MKSITKRIISTLAICGALVLEAGAVAFGSLGKHSVSRVDAADKVTFKFTIGTKNLLPTALDSFQNLTDDTDSNLKAKFKITKNKGSGSTINSSYDSTNGGQGMSTNANRDCSFTFTFDDPWMGTSTGYTEYTKIVSASITGKCGSSTTYSVSSTIDGVAATGTGSSFSSSGATCTFTPATGHNKGQISFTVTYSSGSKACYLQSFSITAEKAASAKYQVTYNSNGAGEDPVIHSVSEFEECMFTAPTGKKFDSWNTSSLGSGTKYDPDDIVPSNITVYAIWKDIPVQKEYTLVTDAGDLEAGDEILLACNSKKVVAGGFNTKYLESTAGTFSDDLSSVTSENGVPLTLGGDSKGWTLTNKDGQIGRSGGDLAIGSANWFISIASNGTATIGDKASSPSNVIKYNSGSPRFKTYASGQTDIQIYKVGSSEPKLSAPTNLKYEDGVLSWTGVANATGYKVSVDEGAATTVTTTSYTVALPQLASVSVIATDSTSTYKDSSAATYLYKNRGSSTNPLSVSDAVTLIEYETGKVNDKYTEEKIYVTGVTTADSTYSSTYSNYDKVTISDGDNTLTIQRATRSDDKTDTIKAGSTVVGYGYGEYYNGCTLYPKGSENPVLTSVIGKTYKVSYKPGAYGTGSEQSDVKEEGVALTLKGAIFTRTGYTQTGWSTNDGGAKVYELNGSYTSDAAATLYPYWEAETYTVSYNKGSYGTGENTSDTKTYNTALTLKGVSFTRKGYTQTGWSTAADGSTKAYELGGSYTDNVATTLYPYWSQKASHSVTYNLNGGSGTAPTQADVVEDLTFTVASATGITKEHYTFAGWSDGSTTYAAGSTYTMGTSNVTLTAQWEPDAPTAHTVTYNLNGGTGIVPTQGDVAEGATFTLATSTGFSKEHFTFAGWSDGSTTYAAGSTYTMGTSNVTLTAQWTAIKHSVTYNLNGGSGTVPTQVDVAETGTFTVAAGTGLSKEHFTFAGWSDGVTVYQAGQTYTMGTSNVTLTAQWTAIKHSVTYDANGGSGTVPTQVDVAETGTFTVAAGTGLSKEHFTFAGWSDGVNTYQPGATYTMGTANITLTAQWTANKYAVTFDGNDADVWTTEVIDETYGSAYVLPVNVPTKVGYHFVGWFTEEVGGTQITSSTIVNLSATQTLYAHFEINVYSVITNAGHSTPESEVTELTHGSAYNNTFTAQEGWYIENITYTIEGSESVTVQGNALFIESVTNNLSITVNTVQIVLDHITVSPESVEIDYDGTVNKDNLVVTAFYNVGKDSARVTDFEITGYDNKTPGTYEATVSYTEDDVTKTTTLTVVVTNKVVSLEVSGYDTTVDQGKDYVFNGKVVAHYQDGSTIENPEGVEVSKLDTSGHGLQTAKVSFGGVSVDITVNVIQTKTPLEPYQTVAVAGGAVIAVSAIAVGIFFFLKKFKI